MSTKRRLATTAALHTARYTCSPVCICPDRQQLANYPIPDFHCPLPLLHPHLVDVHGGAGPAQAPELGDHGGGLGGGLGGHFGGGTRPSGQPLVTTVLLAGSRLPWVAFVRSSRLKPLPPLSLQPHPHTTQSMGGGQ